MLLAKHIKYACNDSKVFIGFKEVSLKAIRSTLQNTITWIKKFSKRCNKWHRACLDDGLAHQKLKTLVKIRFASKVILFQETLEYYNAINLCYERQETQELQG
jgi:hypothetical protein